MGLDQKGTSVKKASIIENHFGRVVFRIKSLSKSPILFLDWIGFAFFISICCYFFYILYIDYGLHFPLQKDEIHTLSGWKMSFSDLWSFYVSEKETHPAYYDYLAGQFASSFKGDLTALRGTSLLASSLFFVLLLRVFLKNTRSRASAAFFLLLILAGPGVRLWLQLIRSYPWQACLFALCCYLRGSSLLAGRKRYVYMLTIVVLGSLHFGALAMSLTLVFIEKRDVISLKEKLICFLFLSPSVYLALNVLWAHDFRPVRVGHYPSTTIEHLGEILFNVFSHYLSPSIFVGMLILLLGMSLEKRFWRRYIAFNLPSVAALIAFGLVGFAGMLFNYGYVDRQTFFFVHPAFLILLYGLVKGKKTIFQLALVFGISYLSFDAFRYSEKVRGIHGSTFARNIEFIAERREEYDSPAIIGCYYGSAKKFYETLVEYHSYDLAPDDFHLLCDENEVRRFIVEARKEGRHVFLEYDDFKEGKRLKSYFDNQRPGLYY